MGQYKYGGFRRDKRIGPQRTKEDARRRRPADLSCLLPLSSSFCVSFGYGGFGCGRRPHGVSWYPRWFPWAIQRGACPRENKANRWGAVRTNKANLSWTPAKIRGRGTGRRRKSGGDAQSSIRSRTGSTKTAEGQGHPLNKPNLPRAMRRASAFWKGSYDELGAQMAWKDKANLPHADGKRHRPAGPEGLPPKRPTCTNKPNSPQTGREDHRQGRRP